MKNLSVIKDSLKRKSISMQCLLNSLVLLSVMLLPESQGFTVSSNLLPARALSAQSRAEPLIFGTVVRSSDRQAICLRERSYVPENTYDGLIPKQQVLQHDEKLITTPAGTSKWSYLSPLFSRESSGKTKSSRKMVLTVSLVGLLSTISLMSGSNPAHAASTLGSTMSVGRSPLFSHWHLLLTCMFLTQALPHNLVGLLGGGLQRMAMWYMFHLHVSPVLTKSITAGVIGVIGDYMAQRLEHLLKMRSSSSSSSTTASTAPSPRKYDKRRSLSILIDGLFISGPLMHYGYELFEHILPVASAAGPSSLAAITHVLADSIFLDSIFVASTFLVTGLMEGFSLRKQLIPQMKRDYPATLMASWVTSLGLLPIEFVCFRYLPVSFRVLAVNFIDVIWDGVISFMAHRNRHEQHHVTAATAADVSSLSITASDASSLSITATTATASSTTETQTPVLSVVG